jgi:hypothetical protein
MGSGSFVGVTLFESLTLFELAEDVAERAFRFSRIELFRVANVFFANGCGGIGHENLL